MFCLLALMFASKHCLFFYVFKSTDTKVRNTFSSYEKVKENETLLWSSVFLEQLSAVLKNVLDLYPNLSYYIGICIGFVSYIFDFHETLPK